MIRTEPVYFEEAIAFFRNKARIPTRHWTDLWQEEHARGFMVAGAARDALLADFQSAILKALKEGETLEQFRARFDEIVARYGWSYHGSRGWRSALIYHTNLRMARAAGNWAKIQRMKERRPYLKYVAIKDERTRHAHRNWDGTVLPVEHDWWKTHFPPNGWNCRCRVVQLSARDLKRYGLSVTDAAPNQPEMRRVRMGDGSYKRVEVPEGIDTGFAYNVGEAGFGRRLSADAMEAWRGVQRKMGTDHAG